MKFTIRLRKYIFSNIFKKDFIINILNNIFYFSNVDLEVYFKSMKYDRRMSQLRLSMLSIGIGYRNDNPLKGETWLIQSVLKNAFFEKKDLVFFDVGANIGEYSRVLCSTFPDSLIFSFEPNPQTFNKLSENLDNINNIKVHNFGLSSGETGGDLFSYENDVTSGHASLLKGVFVELYKNESIKSFTVNLKTLDSFCAENDIDEIHLLKIDTEGYEIEVLKGSFEMLASNKINMIQFEFNEMNILNRIYLRDFFNLLDNYHFFRVSDGELLDISNYKTENEIFWYQDILCVLKTNIELMDIINDFVIYEFN